MPDTKQAAARQRRGGHGYMSFGVATARFKKALIPMLQSGKPISGVFEEVLGEKGLAADAGQCCDSPGR